jgi:hypothetical protein
LAADAYQKSPYVSPPPASLTVDDIQEATVGDGPGAFHQHPDAGPVADLLGDGAVLC